MTAFNVSSGDGVLGELELLGELIIGGFPDDVFTLVGVNVDEVLDTVRLYDGFASQAAAASARTRGLQIPEFVGVEGEFFRGRVPVQLAGQLDAAAQSFESVAGGVRDLARELDAAQTALKPLEARGRAVFEHMQAVWIKVNVPFTEYSRLRGEWDELVKAATVVHERVVVAAQHAAQRIEAGSDVMARVSEFYSVLPGGAVVGGAAGATVRSTATRAASTAQGAVSAPGRAVGAAVEGAAATVTAVANAPVQAAGRGQQILPEVTSDGVRIGDVLLTDPASPEAQRLVQEGRATNVLGLDPSGIPTAMMMLASPSTLVRDHGKRGKAARRWVSDEGGAAGRAADVAVNVAGQVVSVPGRFVGGLTDRVGNTISGNAALVGIGGDPGRAWVGLASNVINPINGVSRGVTSATPAQILEDPVAAAGATVGHAPVAVPFVGWAYGLVEMALKPGELSRAGAAESIEDSLDKATLNKVEGVAEQTVANAGTVEVTTSDVDVHLDNGGYVTFTLPDLEGGEPKAWYIMATPDSPGNFTTQVQTALDEELVERADGSVVLVNTTTGQTVRTIKTPWAKDALGRDQPTWYSIEKIDDSTSTITQHVQPSRGALYPLVADAPAKDGEPTIVSCNIDGTVTYSDGSRRPMAPPPQTQNTRTAQAVADVVAPKTGPLVQQGPYLPGNSPTEQNQRAYSNAYGNISAANPGGNVPSGQQPSVPAPVQGGMNSQAGVDAQRLQQERNRLQYEADLRAAAQAEAEKAQRAEEVRKGNEERDNSAVGVGARSVADTDSVPSSAAVGPATAALNALVAQQNMDALAKVSSNLPTMGPVLPASLGETEGQNRPTTFIGPASGPVNPIPETPRTPAESLISFGAGLGRGTADSITGFAALIRDPSVLAPLVGLGEDGGPGVADSWKQVARAMIAADDYERGDTAYANGKVLANVITALVGTKGTSTLSKAGKAALAAEVERVVSLSATAPKPAAWAQAVQQSQLRVAEAESRLAEAVEAAGKAAPVVPTAAAAAVGASGNGVVAEARSAVSSATAVGADVSAGAAKAAPNATRANVIEAIESFDEAIKRPTSASGVAEPRLEAAPKPAGSAFDPHPGLARHGNEQARVDIDPAVSARTLDSPLSAGKAPSMAADPSPRLSPGAELSGSAGREASHGLGPAQHDPVVAPRLDLKPRPIARTITKLDAAMAGFRGGNVSASELGRIFHSISPNFGRRGADEVLQGLSRPRIGDSNQAVPGGKIIQRPGAQPGVSHVSPDHVIPIAKMIEMKGFDRLTGRQVYDLLNWRGNLQWLDSTENGVKMSRSAAQMAGRWSPDFIREQIALESRLRRQIPEIINAMLRINESVIKRG